MTDDFHKYRQALVDEGFIERNGKPLKCQSCSNTDFVRYNIVRSEIGLIEYMLRCDSCEDTVGYWSYGYWID